MPEYGTISPWKSQENYPEINSQFQAKAAKEKLLWMKFMKC
jgi:hypothetical protein